MDTVLHMNLRIESSHFIPQIRQVPDYDYVHVYRRLKDVVESSLINEKVIYMNNIYNPQSFVANHNIKLIHAHHGELGMALLPFKEQTNLPMVTSIRGRDATFGNQPYNYYLEMKKLFQRTDRFFPVCQYLADQLIEWGCPPEKIRVLYGGVNLNKFDFQPKKEGHSTIKQLFRNYNKESINILSIGRLVEKKGHHILMGAFSLIKEKLPNAKLTIVGKGYMEQELIQLARDLNLGDSFQLLQHLHYDEVHEQMRNADIFCAASLTATNGDIEGIPNTLKEAMATGIPVITTNHAGIPELVEHNESGIIVEQDNVEELAYGLEYMLTQRHKWGKFATLARKTIEEKFNLEKQLKLQSIYYNELLKK